MKNRGMSNALRGVSLVVLEQRLQLRPWQIVGIRGCRKYGKVWLGDEGGVFRGRPWPRRGCSATDGVDGWVLVNYELPVESV